MKTRTRKQALQSVKAKASTVARFMNSPIGRKVIKMLEDEYPVQFGTDPHDTYRKLGNREPIEYLKQLQRINESEDLDNEEV